MVRGCATCLSTASHPPRLPVHSWEPPQGPWQRVHIDFAGPMQGVWYLIIVDAYSKWVETYSTRSTTTARTVELLDECFSRFGYPAQLVSDNATNFTSEDFSAYLRARGIEHRRSAPFHPATNGQAERTVQIIKKGILKMGNPQQSPLEFNQFLLRLRNQPSQSTGKSPAELMFKRDLRDRLSQLVELPPSRTKPSEPSRFSVGDKVAARLYQGSSKWITGVVHRLLGSRHVLIETKQGVLRRHADQVKRTDVEPAQGYPMFLHLWESALVPQSAISVLDDPPIIGLEFDISRCTRRGPRLTSTPVPSRIARPQPKVDYKTLHSRGR